MSEPLHGTGPAQAPDPATSEDGPPSSEVPPPAAVPAQPDMAGQWADDLEARRQRRRQRLQARAAMAERKLAAADRAAAIARAVAATDGARRMRARRVVLAFSILVGGPTLIAAAYYGAVATGQYESVAVLALDRDEPADRSEHLAPKPGASDPLLQAVRAHLQSRDQLARLDGDQGLLRHYRDARIDWLSRLGRDAGSEAAHDYYLARVSVVAETEGGTLTLRARAFSATRARDLARALVVSAERFVERSSERARADLQSAATSGLEAARDRLDRARAAPPGASTEVELELAREQMQSAQRAAEMARVEAARRHRQVLVVAAPSLPDEATYPRRAWGVATVFFGALVLVVVLWLVVAVVREHAVL